MSEQRASSVALTRLSLLAGVLIGASYGLFLRFIEHFKMVLPHQASMLMTLTFLALGPFAIGYITIYSARRAAPQGVWNRIFLPWPAVVLGAALTALLNLEGAICILFILPIALVFSSIGGLAAGFMERRGRSSSASTLASVALLPFLLAPAETYLRAPVQRRTVNTQILIHASAPVVWSNIERVRAIAPSELSQTWAHRVGFPRPVEATLSFEGVGGVRHASFEHGLVFLETVTLWEPDHTLAFSIQADTAHIPSATLDEHVTVGGRYFDVLAGQYTIEPLPNHDILLHLSSTERLSTDFNGYAGLWSDAVMRTLQQSILEVIKHRCEAV